MRIILASGSPRRRLLLASIGVEFTVYRPDVDESRKPGESPAEMCSRLAMLKAEAGSHKYPGDIVIAADTIVVIGGQIMGKPHDRKDAVRMLRELSGREHEVITGLAVSCRGVTQAVDVHTAVRFRELSDREIAAYVATGECDDKAGAYAVQGKGSLLIEGIRGDYYNVVGLPLCRLGIMLQGFGVNLL